MRKQPGNYGFYGKKEVLHHIRNFILQRCHMIGNALNFTSLSCVEDSSFRPDIKNCTSQIMSRHVGGLVQERHKCIANALELRIFCTNASMYSTSSLLILINSGLRIRRIVCIISVKYTVNQSMSLLLNNSNLDMLNFFGGNINIYLQFLWFLNTVMVQVVEILSHGSQRPVYPT